MVRRRAGCVAAAILIAAVTANAQEKWELAPGILQVIPADPQTQDTFSGPIALNDLKTAVWTPQTIPATETLAEMAQRVTIRRPVWQLEFAFKPLRMVVVDIPVRRGYERKRIWYLVYRVRYLGDDDLIPTPEQQAFSEQTFPTTLKEAFPSVERRGSRSGVRFFPKFVLSENYELKKSYPDRVIPAAKQLIFDREFSPTRTENPDGQLFDTVEISLQDVPLSNGRDGKGIWGVVTWEDIDPRVDYFSVLVTGLTNAMRLDSKAGRYGQMAKKVLKLNFWRPGDSVDETEREIQFGIPVMPDPKRQDQVNARYGQANRVDFLWGYQ